MDKRKQLHRSKSVFIDRKNLDNFLSKSIQQQDFHKKPTSSSSSSSSSSSEKERGRLNSFTNTDRKAFDVPQKTRVAHSSTRNKSRENSRESSRENSSDKKTKKEERKHKRSRSVFRLTRQKSAGFLGLFRKKGKDKDQGSGSLESEGNERNGNDDNNNNNFGESKSKAEEELKRINMTFKPGINDISYCASVGDVSEMKTLIRLGTDVNLVDEHANTPLHYAVYARCPLGIKELLKCRELNPNLKNNNGLTPLMIASMNGFENCVQVLIKSGRTHLYEKNSSGKTALEMAEDIEVINLLTEQISLEKEFLKLCGEKDFCRVRDLVENVDINVRNEDGENALTIAAKKKNNKKVLEILLDNRILFDKEDVDKSLPEYGDFLREKYNRLRREQVVEELYMTEKGYNFDLNLIVSIFIRSETGGNSNDSVLKGLIKKGDYLMGVKKMFERVQLVRATSMQFIKRLKNWFPQRKFSNQERIVNCLETVNYGYYNSLIQTQTLLEELIKKRKTFKEFRSWVKKQAKKIPYPKIQDFYSILSKPRFRLIKYKDLMIRMMKYTQKKTDMYKSLKRYTGKIKIILREIDQRAGEIKNKKNMMNIHNLLKARFKFDDLLPAAISKSENEISGVTDGNKKNIELIQDEGVLKGSNTKNPMTRQYVMHELGINSWDSKNFNLKKFDLYLFSDSIFIGDVQKKDLEFYFFTDSKIIFDCSKDQLRCRIYSINGFNLKADVFFNLGIKTGPKWARAIEDAFFANSLETAYYYYMSRIKLNNNSVRETYDDNFLRFKGYGSGLKENQSFWIKHTERICRDHRVHMKDMKKKIKRMEKDLKETEYNEVSLGKKIQMIQPENEKKEEKEKKKSGKHSGGNSKNSKKNSKRQMKTQSVKISRTDKLKNEEKETTISPLSDKVKNAVDGTSTSSNETTDELSNIEEKIKEVDSSSDEIKNRLKKMEERRKRIRDKFNKNQEKVENLDGESVVY